MQSDPRRRLPGRPGYTLMEMLVSVAAASALLVGLGSSILLASRAFDGNGAAYRRARATEVQNEILVDLRNATGFKARNTDSVTFTVPDRNNDGVDETITYAWTGSGTKQLTYSINGGPATPLLEDVTAFQLTYSSRFIPGSSAAPPPLDPSKWGERWRTGPLFFGYNTQYILSDSDSKKQIATRATLSEAGIVKSMTAYIGLPYGGSSDISFAIYDVDSSNRPRNLLTNSSVASVSVAGWYSLDLTPITLQPGTYYLALSYRSNSPYYYYDSTTGTTYITNHDACQRGWKTTWDGFTVYTRRISIYASYDLP